MSFLRLAALLSYQAPVICIAICTYVFCSLRRNGITRKQFIQLRLMALGCIGCMVFEVLNGMLSLGLVNWDLRLLIVFSTLAYGFTIFFTVLLSEFCISKVTSPSKLICALIRIAYLLSALLIAARIVLYGTHLFTYFGENGEVMYGPLDDLQTWCCALANALLVGLILIRYLDRSDFVNRERNGKLLFAAVSVTVTVMIYAVFYLPYIIWMGYMLVLMILFTDLQKLMIDRDELTSLSNRRRMLKEIEEMTEESSPWSYILIDVNSFKQVNDTYGHNEGDHALQIVASVLDTVASGNGAAAYRIGGDEFAVVASSGEEAAVSGLCAKLEEELSSRAENERLPYPLTISFGYTVYAEMEGKDLHGIMEKADGRMYEDKRRKAALRQKKPRRLSVR